MKRSRTIKFVRTHKPFGIHAETKKQTKCAYTFNEGRLFFIYQKALYDSTSTQSAGPGNDEYFLRTDKKILQSLCQRLLLKSRRSCV